MVEAETVQKALAFSTSTLGSYSLNVNVFRIMSSDRLPWHSILR